MPATWLASWLEGAKLPIGKNSYWRRIMVQGSVFADTITAMAVFTGVAIAILLYLVSERTTSFWYIARVYSLAVVIAFGLAIVSFSVTPYVFFPGLVVITYIGVVVGVAVNLFIIFWNWRRSWKRPTQG